MKNKSRAITYSLLAHIRNYGDLIKGPFDIFVPLIKRVISQMNSRGIYKGKSLLEIKAEADNQYQIDFPLPVIRKILELIVSEVNTDERTNFVLNTDGSFQILEYTFDEFDEIINSKEKEVERLEVLYIEFTESINIEKSESNSIFRFIEKNKYSLSKYLSKDEVENNDDFTIEAQFINFFKKIPVIYDLVKEIYLGSILACYVEYVPEKISSEVELLLDTNFIVGLLDLNTPESTHTCRTLIEVSRQNGYKVSVLKCTIEETENLLKRKANGFDKSFLQKKINPENVFNACDRRNIYKNDLEKIADNIIPELSTKYGVNIYHEHDKYTNAAKHSKEYEYLKQVRVNDLSALHDATAITYVKKKRKKYIQEFEKVNCWFVNNSSSHYIERSKKHQSEIIKADDLLNILWLSSPSINKKIDNNAN